VTRRVLLAAGQGVEEDAAWRWLESRGEFAARRVDPLEIGEGLEANVVWVHATAPVAPASYAPLISFLARGGGLLLTLRGTELLASLGLEREGPNDVRLDRWSHAADELHRGEAGEAIVHRRGLAFYGPHPLADGLHGGADIWAPSEHEPYVRACFSRGARPSSGRAIAVERGYISLNPERIVAWEYAVGRGLVLCIGGFVNFAAPDPLLRPQLERLVLNALASSLDHFDPSPRTYWPVAGKLAAQDDGLELPEGILLDGALPEPLDDPIALQSDVETDEQFDLAGRRLLLVGRDRLGIREIWAHPHRVVCSWDITADGEPALGTRILVTPDAVVRTLETSRRRLTERLFVALEHPVAVVEYVPERRGRESVGRGPERVELTFTIDLRRSWPYAAGCGGDLRFRREPGGGALVVASESHDGVAAILVSPEAAIVMEPVHRGDAPAVLCQVAAPLGQRLRLAVVGGNNHADLERNLRALRHLGIAGLVRQRVQRAAALGDARLVVRAAEPGPARAFEWAKRRLDLFLGDVPGVGRSLMAGYAPSTPGWGDGRPGYAWFFGRDACWSAFALLEVGEFSLVRQVIRFLGDHQDLSGKVLHEATTSGQFHYDAADSTPLYLLLVGRYLAWSGDRDFVASVWPRVERALSFCISADSDGDGLMENARVGHGWIESGPLAGARVTLYLAAVWRAALEAVSRAAEVLGNSGVAAKCRERTARAGEAIEREFYDTKRKIYALDRRIGGQLTWTQTALQAVPLLLGCANTSGAQRWFDETLPSLATPWGVRLVPPSDPHFNPTGYHCGTVWPLFTGWAALAAYRAGRGEEGFRHLAANLRLAFKRQGGAFDEVLHGLEERAAGVCPDQAWSAAMAIAPLVEGLLGVMPDAPAGRLALRPQLPAAWPMLDVLGLRCGETVYDVRLRRRDEGLVISLRRNLGPPLWLTIAPHLVHPPARVEVDGEELRPSTEEWGRGLRCAVEFEAHGEHEVRFVTT
jgi:hypothetical protein